MGGVLNSQNMFNPSYTLYACYKSGTLNPVDLIVYVLIGPIVVSFEYHYISFCGLLPKVQDICSLLKGVTGSCL